MRPLSYLNEEEPFHMHSLRTNMRCSLLNSRAAASQLLRSRSPALSVALRTAAYSSSSPASSSSESTWASYKEDYRRDHQRILSYNDPLAHKINGRVFKPDTFLLPTNDPLPFPIIEGYNLNAESVKIPVDQTCDVKLVGLSLRGGFDYVVRSCLTHAARCSIINIDDLLLARVMLSEILGGSF